MDPEELKVSKGPAQKRPDNGNDLLMDFVQAVRTEYDRQTSTPQVLKWPSMEPVVKSLRALENTPISESQHKIFIEYILQYLEISLCFISSFENTSYRKQKHYAAALIGFLPNFFNDLDLKNTFIPEATAKILDLFTYGDFSTVSKTALLRMYNEIATGSKKQIRTDTAESINYYMYKLIDSLSTYGDFMIQSDIIETLFRIFGSQIRNSCIKYELLPGFEELGKSLISDISIKNFEVDVRRWLNKFNKESSSIFSLPCKMLIFGNTVFGNRLNDNADVIWVDFNMKENMICFHTGDLDVDQWNWIVIMTKDVKKVEVDRQFTSTENTTVFMQLSKPCISDLFERQEYWNSLDRHFKIIISSDEKEKITKLISHVLPRLFGDTFSHTSARISSRLKPVYKPLKISKKRSSHSDLSSVSSKSNSNAVQPGPSRHSAVRVRSPSVSGSNGHESSVVAMKQSDLQLNLVEDNVSVAVTDFTRCSSRQSGITSRRTSASTSPTSDMFMSVSSLADLENPQEIKKIQDNIVTSSHGFDDEILAQTRIQILSGQSTDSRPVSMHGNVSEFRPSEEFSSTPVKTSKLTLKEFSNDEILGDAKIMEQRNPLDENENVAPVAQKISTLLGDVETLEQLKPSAKHEKEALVSQKMSTYLGDVETAEQLKPADKTEKEVSVFQKISSLTIAEDVDENSNNKSPSQKDLCEDDFFSAEIGNIEQKKDYIDKVKENYVMKVSSLIVSEDIKDDNFETAVEHLTEDVVDKTFYEQNDRGDKTHESIEVCKKLSQFVGDNLQRDVDLSSDDELVQPDAETKISHYDVDKNMEQNENHYISTSKIDSKSANENIQKLKPEESSQCLPSKNKMLWRNHQSKLDITIPFLGADLNRTNCRQYCDIPTPDLFDLPTEVNKVDSIQNEELNDSQNDSEDLFSRTTQENIKVDQKSQSSDQTFNMLSLAVNVGVSECQYSENVAVVKPVIESKETYQSDTKSYEKSNDQMIDLTLDEDDAKIMKEVEKSQDGKVATNKSLLNAPKLLQANVIGISEHEAVVKSLTESGKKSNETSKDNIIDLTVIDDADIMKEVAQSQVQHENILVEKITGEPLLNTPDLFGILASGGSGAAGSELLINGPEKTGTSLTDEAAREKNLTAKKKPRTLIKTGKKQFRLEALSDESDAPKELEGIISEESNRTVDEVVCIESGITETQATTGPYETHLVSKRSATPAGNDASENHEKIVNEDQNKDGCNNPAENSDSDLEWAPEMNADNMDFIATFDKIKEMEEQKTAASIHSEEKTVVGNKDVVDTDTLLKNLYKENNLTQLSGKTDFIRKKAGKRIISDSEMSEVGEDHVLGTTEMKKNIENDSKVDNLDSLKKEPQLYVKISSVIKKPKESKRAKPRPPLKEIGQVKLGQHVYSKTGEPQVTVQKDGNQIPHETQNEVAHADEEPVSRTGRDVVGDEIVEEETKSKNICKGAGNDNRNEVSPSLYKQDEKADVSMQKGELVPDASSDRQVADSMVGGEKRDSSPKAVHHQIVVTTVQVHCVANEQQNDAIVSQTSAEEHPEGMKSDELLLAKDISTISNRVKSPVIKPVQYESSPISEIAKIKDLPNLDFAQDSKSPTLKRDKHIPQDKKSTSTNKVDFDQNSDLIRQKRSPILTRNRSREPVTAKSPVDVILQNNDIFEGTEIEKCKTAGGRKLWRPGSYSYLDDLIDVEMKTPDSESLPIAVEKGTKIPKQRKPRTKAKKEEIKPSGKKNKGKTPRKSTKLVEEPAKESVKKRRPRRRKEFSLSTTNFKSLDELFDVTCKHFANDRLGYNYSRQSKSLHRTPRDILVRYAPRNSSSEESPELTKFLDKKLPSLEYTAPQSSEYSWLDLESIPENTNAPKSRPKINILQDIVITPKRPAGDESSSPVSKKPKLDVTQDMDNIPAIPAVLEHDVQNATKEAGTDEEVLPDLLNTLRFVITLIEARHKRNCIQKLKQISAYIDELK